MEQHTILNGTKEFGYSGIDDSSKVQILMKGIKTTEFDVCKGYIMDNPSIRDKFSGTVELYLKFIKQVKADDPQMNVSEVH
jgi:hypothetical protein